jgi:IclR family KDG regulon transcriptional repressor
MDTTLIKGLGLLARLARAPGPRSIAELAQEQGLHKSNIHRVLKTLMHCGFVLQLPDGRYAPTLQLWELGNAVVERIDLGAIARPVLERLGRDSGEDVYLATLEGVQTVFIDRWEGVTPLRPYYRLGTRLPSHCNAAGKAMLAHLDEAALLAATARLKRYTGTTLATRPQLLAELERIRAQGFAVNNAEREPGAYSVAAAVRSGTGQPVASFAMMLPAARMAPAPLAAAAGMVRRAAAELAAALRGAPLN